MLQQLQDQISTYETAPRDYSSRQRGAALAGPVPFIDPSLKTYDYDPNPLAELIAHSPTVDKLSEIFGGDSPPVFVSFAYDISCIGTPGISLHTDMQPYGSTLFGGTLFSSPQLVRVLYYLDDLTLDVSPFRCIPRSHLSMHADANPYTRYAEHPGETISAIDGLLLSPPPSMQPPLARYAASRCCMLLRAHHCNRAAWVQAATADNRLHCAWK